MERFWWIYSRISLLFLNFKLQFFSSPLVFFLYSRAARVVSQISQSRRRSLTLTLENWRGHFSRTVSLFSRSFGKLFTSFRSHKFVIILFVILRSFGVFISAKCCGSFNKFFRSLDSSFFFRKWIFYICSTFFYWHRTFSFLRYFCQRTRYYKWRFLRCLGVMISLLPVLIVLITVQ